MTPRLQIDVKRVVGPGSTDRAPTIVAGYAALPEKPMRKFLAPGSTWSFVATFLRC
jgi:hypothetical protein